MYYVYILVNYKNKTYIGFTNDLKRRVKEHKSGNVSYTNNKGPWTLKYYEAFPNKIDARREEMFLKSGKGRQRINNLFIKTFIRKQ